MIMLFRYKKVIFSGIFTLGILFLPGAVLAAVDIDTDLPTGPLVSETNVLPGDVFTRTVTIQKTSDVSPLSLMIKFTRTNSIETYNLESKILVRIQRLSDDVFLTLPGGGTEATLESLYDYIDAANDNAFGFDTISGTSGSTFQYKLWFTFDPSTGNEYQKKETVFDISAGIYTVPTILKTTDDGDDDDGGRRRRRRGGGGPLTNPTGGFFRGFPGVTGTIAGEETNEGESGIAGGEGENPEIAGEETTCRYWPVWVWILSIVVFALNFWRNARKNYKQEKYRWIFPLTWTIAAAAFWYFFDKCREYYWFLYGSIIIAILSHFIYLYYLRKKVKKGLPVEKEEKTEENNISQQN